MFKRVWLWVVVGLIVIVGLGPIFVAKVADRVFKSPKELMPGAVLIKASGKVSIEQGKLILTTPKGINNYLLSGERIDELKRFADKEIPIYVFGRLTKTDLRKAQDKVIRATIDITDFSTRDFSIGQKMSPEVAAAIRLKVKEKTDFRQAILKKLHKKEDSYVVSGKLRIVPALNTRDGKQSVCLVVTDKYGDSYVLSNNGGLKYPAENYRNLASADLEIVAVGEVTLPNPSIVVLGEKGLIPFAAEGIYNNNEELSEVVINK